MEKGYITLLTDSIDLCPGDDFKIFDIYFTKELPGRLDSEELLKCYPNAKCLIIYPGTKDNLTGNLNWSSGTASYKIF